MGTDLGSVRTTPRLITGGRKYVRTTSSTANVLAHVTATLAPVVQPPEKAENQVELIYQNLPAGSRVDIWSGRMSL
jgi:hypothetical protein